LFFLVAAVGSRVLMLFLVVRLVQKPLCVSQAGLLSIYSNS
jgi:hypothetical protein